MLSTIPKGTNGEIRKNMEANQVQLLDSGGKVIYKGYLPGGRPLYSFKAPITGSFNMKSLFGPSGKAGDILHQVMDDLPGGEALADIGSLFFAQAPQKEYRMNYKYSDFSPMTISVTTLCFDKSYISNLNNRVLPIKGGIPYSPRVVSTFVSLLDVLSGDSPMIGKSKDKIIKCGNAVQEKIENTAFRDAKSLGMHADYHPGGGLVYKEGDLRSGAGGAYSVTLNHVIIKSARVSIPYAYMGQNSADIPYYEVTISLEGKYTATVENTKQLL